MTEVVGHPRFSRRRLLVTLVVVMAVSGLGMGMFSSTAVEDTSAVTPPDSPPSRSQGATISTTVTDPFVVRSERGDIGAVSGTLDGSLALRRDVSRVKLVVETRLPNGNWVVIERAAFRPEGTGVVDLSTHVGGPETTYLDASQSEAFEVEDAPSLERYHGAVAVTAVLYQDDEVVASVTDGDRYELLVDRPGEMRMGPEPAAAESQ